MCEVSRITQKNIAFDFLNDHGKSELEFILSYTNKKYKINLNYTSSQVANLLLLIMPSCEVYCVIDALITKSRDIFLANEQNNYHWTIC